MDSLIGKSIRNTTIITEKKTDIMLHLLAHYDIGNAASNFDAEYVKSIAVLKSEKKSSLQQKLLEINDENLVYLSFMPAFFTKVDSLFRGLACLASKSEPLEADFTEMEIRCIQFLQNLCGGDTHGIAKFAEITEFEYDHFYSSHWNSRTTDYRKGIELFKEMWESKENDTILAFLRAHGLPAITVYLSEGMRRNGRGTRTDDSSTCTVTGMPVNHHGVFMSYYIAVHELVHQIVDGITQSILKFDPQQRSLSQNDKGYSIHEQMENSVIYTQHLLMRNTIKTRTEDYYAVVSALSDVSISNESEFMVHFQVDNRIREKLESMIQLNQ